MLNISKLKRYRHIFPELTDSEIQILIHYAQGTSIHCIADIMKSTLPAIKQTLQRTKNKLELDKLESARGLFNARVHVAMFSESDDLSSYYGRHQKQNSSDPLKHRSSDYFLT